MPTRLAETTPLAEAGTSTSTHGTLRVQAISAGVGSSGYYSPEVLEQAATDQLIARGTFLHLDHASETERTDRPERSVSTIAGVFTEAATYDPDTQALVGDVQLFEPYRERLMEMAPYIGLSISGSATDVTEGEHDGRRVPVIERLAAIDSVDFVTRAGRGGRALLECARPSDVVERAVRHGVREATADERREQLSDVVRGTHGGEDHYVWIRDFDDTTVWFEVHADDEPSHTYAQAYSVTDDDTSVSLTGSRAEVRAVTRYLPVRPGGNTTSTEESEEDTMPNIEESELNRLREDAGRVATLESERDTATSERDEARLERDQLRARESATTRARARLAEGQTALAPATVDRIVAESTRSVPLTAAGQLDETALDTAVDAARTAEEAYLAQLAPGGNVSGFGGQPAGGQTQLSEADLDGAVGAAFGRTQVKEA